MARKTVSWSPTKKYGKYNYSLVNAVKTKKRAKTVKSNQKNARISYSKKPRSYRNRKTRYAIYGR